ncbi:hypothetical protein DSECCO2_587250 [anaerobic digester metagenome]
MSRPAGAASMRRLAGWPADCASAVRLTAGSFGRPCSLASASRFFSSSPAAATPPLCAVKSRLKEDGAPSAVPRTDAPCCRLRPSRRRAGRVASNSVRKRDETGSNSPFMVSRVRARSAASRIRTRSGPASKAAWRRPSRPSSSSTSRGRPSMSVAFTAMSPDRLRASGPRAPFRDETKDPERPGTAVPRGTCRTSILAATSISRPSRPLRPTDAFSEARRSPSTETDSKSPSRVALALQARMPSGRSGAVARISPRACQRFSSAGISRTRSASAADNALPE